MQMLGSLYDALENDYGSIATRLYRAFKPKTGKSSISYYLILVSTFEGFSEIVDVEVEKVVLSTKHSNI